jgi:hypothetical protein
MVQMAVLACRKDSSNRRKRQKKRQHIQCAQPGIITLLRLWNQRSSAWDIGGIDQPMTVAHIIPPVRSVTPVMKIAVSNRVSSQLSGMVRLNVGLSRSSVASIY